MTSAESPANTNTSVCPRCGAGLRCAMVAGDAKCWCVRLPQVMPIPPARPDPSRPDNGAATCFCPACLRQITDERKNDPSNSAD